VLKVEEPMALATITATQRCLATLCNENQCSSQRPGSADAISGWQRESA
jgi:hypothetical protein